MKQCLGKEELSLYSLYFYRIVDILYIHGMNSKFSRI